MGTRLVLKRIYRVGSKKVNDQNKFVRFATGLFSALLLSNASWAQNAVDSMPLMLSAVTTPPVSSKTVVPAATSAVAAPAVDSEVKPAVVPKEEPALVATVAPTTVASQEKTHTQQVADLLAGRIPPAGLPDNLKKSAKWSSYSQAVQTNWDLYSQKIGVPMTEWAKQQVPLVQDTVFYPFSGPDFTTVYQLFPNAKRYVMVAMQNAGRPLDLGDLTATTTEQNLDLLTSAWKHYGTHGFFVTEYLDKYFYSTPSRIGASTFLTTFLNLHGFQVDRVVPIEVLPNGEVKELSAETEKWRSVRFNASKDGKQIVLDYLKIDLSNEGFAKSPENLEYIRREVRQPVLFKAASHLPQNNNFSVIANEVLKNAPLVVQDETGIKYTALMDTYNVALYGKFVVAHHSFTSYHGDLAKGFAQRNDVKPLTFRFGYFKDGNYAVIVALRK